MIEALNTGFEAGKDRLVVSTGVGNHQMMSCQFIRWVTPRSIVSSGSLGTMGFGLPAAIGAQASILYTLYFILTRRHRGAGAGVQCSAVQRSAAQRSAAQCSTAQ